MKKEKKKKTDINQILLLLMYTVVQPLVSEVVYLSVPYLLLKVGRYISLYIDLQHKN